MWTWPRLALLLFLGACSGGDDIAPPLTSEAPTSPIEVEPGTGASERDVDVAPTVAESAERAPAARAEPVDSAPAPLVRRTIRLRTLDGQVLKDQPLAHVDVEVGYRLDDPVDVSLGTWNTGTEGVARFQVEVPEDERLRFWARTSAPGYTRRKWSPRSDVEGVVRIDVRSRRGRTYRGSVVDSDGAPVPARVVLVGEGGTQTWARSVETADGPAFELDLCDRGTFELFARSPGHGTAHAQGVALDWEQDSEPELVLVVQGPGHLEGTLREATGRPMPGVVLLAVQDSEDLEPHREPYRWEHAYSPGGLRWLETETDADGRYAFHGLAVGRYHLSGELKGENVRNVALTSEPVPHDAGEVDLTFEAHRIRVRVLDARGAPLAFDPMASAKVGQEQPAWLALLPEEPPTPPSSTSPLRVHARRSNGQGVATAFLYHDAWSATEDPREWDLLVEPGASYLISAESLDSPLVQLEVAVEQGRYEQTAELRLAEPTGHGQVHVRFEAPPVGASPTWLVGNLESLHGTVRALPSNLVLRTVEVPFGRPVELDLAPGRYSLTAEARGEPVYCGTGLNDANYELKPRPVSVEFELAAHQRLERVVRFEPRAKVYVTVAVVGRDASEPAPHIEVHARSEDGETRTLGFHEEVLDPPNEERGYGIVRELPVDWISPDHPQTCRDELLPGTWVLTPVLPGYVGEPVEVRLEHGVNLPVHLRLTPR